MLMVDGIEEGQKVWETANWELTIFESIIRMFQNFYTPNYLLNILVKFAM